MADLDRINQDIQNGLLGGGIRVKDPTTGEVLEDFGSVDKAYQAGVLKETGLLGVTQAAPVYRVNNQWTTTEPTNASISLDKATGNIKVVAPKSVTNDPEFKESLSLYETYSGNYKVNPNAEYTLKNSDGTTESVSLEEYIERLNTPTSTGQKDNNGNEITLSPFQSQVNQYIWLNSVRDFIGPQYRQMDAEGNVSNVWLSRDDIVRMTTNALGADVKDSTRLAVPKGIKAFQAIYDDAEWDDNLSTISVGKFREIWHNRDKTSQQEILNVYGDLGRYLADAKRGITMEENVDTEKWTATYALYTFLSESDPTCSLFKNAWDAIGAVTNASGHAATNYFALGAQVLSGATEKIVDLTMNLFETGLSENPFRDHPETNFGKWAKDVNEIFDIVWFGREWGMGLRDFEKAAGVKYDLDRTKEELKSLLGVGIDEETAARLRTEGADPNMNSVTKALQDFGTSLIQLGVGIYAGDVLAGAAKNVLGGAASTLINSAESLEDMVEFGTKAWTAVMGAKGVANVLNLVAFAATSPISVASIGLVGETIGEAIFQNPTLTSEILRSDDLAPEAQAYLWETFVGNAVGLGVATALGKGAMKIGETAWGQGVSRNMQNFMWKWQGKIADTFDGIRMKLTGSNDVVEWLDHIGSKGITEAGRSRYAQKEAIMAQQRTLRRARQAIAENSPHIKVMGESAESVLEQISKADDLIDNFFKYEDVLDDIARGNTYRKLTMLEDNPLFNSANTNLQKIAGDLVDLQARAGLKTAEKVGELSLFNSKVSEYINARLRTDIGNSVIAAKNVSKAVNATEGIEAIQKELTHWNKVIADFHKNYGGLVAKADEYVDATKKWWQEFNNARLNMGMISEIDLAKWREDGYWGKNGELYARQQRKAEQSDYIIRRRDGKVDRKLERDMGHYNWGSAEEFVDPMLVAQQEFEMAAEQANRIEAVRTYSDITGTASIKKTAEDVRVAKEARPYLQAYNKEVHQNIKPLVGELETEGLFNEEIKAHQLRQEAKNAESVARQVERTRLSRKTPTMGEMQSTLTKLDDASIDVLWEEVYGTRSAQEVEQVIQQLSDVEQRAFRKYTAVADGIADGDSALDTIQQVIGRNNGKAGTYYAGKRGEVAELLKRAKVGDTLTTPSLFSTSRSQEVAQDFFNRYAETEAAIQVQIRSAGGRGISMDIQDFSVRPYEMEELFPQGTLLKIVEPFDPTTRQVVVEVGDTVSTVTETEQKRRLLMQNDATRKTSYMQDTIMEARQMEYDQIMRYGYSEAAENAAVLSAEAEAQEELIYDLGSRTLDDFSETFFARGTNANKVSRELMLRYGGEAPDALGEYLYYDALKKNKASLAKEVKARAKKAFQDYAVEVDGKLTHPYKNQAEYLANRVSKNVSDQVEVRFNSSRVAVSNMGGDASRLIDHESWQREIYELANEISDLKTANNIIAIPNTNGETELVEIDPLLALFVNSSTQYTPMGLLGRANYLWMRLFRLGTTGLNPSSWVNQYYRDLGNAWVMGNVSQTISGAVEELTAIFGQDAGTFLAQYSQEVQENLLKLAKEESKDIAQVMAERELRRGKLYAQASSESELTRLWRGTKNQWFTGSGGRTTWDKAMDILDKVEEKATIVNETREKYLRNLVYSNNFAEAIKGGKSMEQARTFAEYIASNATTNFTRGVTFMNQFQNTIPYFRSAINGTRSFYRLWSVDPVGVTGRIVGGLVIPAFALTMYSLSSDENRAEYKKIQAYQKENSLPIVMNGEAFFIPLPQELSAFVAPFRQAAEAINGLGYNNALEVTVNDLLALIPVDFGGFTDIDSWRIYGEGPDWTERLTRGSAQLFSQIMPKWATAAATAMSGRDLYTGNKIDTSYVTVDPDTGEQQVMSYSAGTLANALNKVFPNLAAPIAQEMLENIFGTAGTQIVDFLADIAGQTSSGNFNYLAAGQSFLEDVAHDLTKPMRPYIEARESADWRHALSDLYDLKNDILSPNTPQGQAWQSMLTNKRNATTQTERDAVATARANILDPFYKEAMAAVNRLIQANPASFTDYKLGAVLSLFNFGTVGDTVNNAAADYASDLYKQSKYAAIETMVNLGFPNVNTPSILGSIVKSQSTGETYIKWNTPLQILDMENTIYTQGAIYAADIKRLLQKNNITSDKLSEVWDAYYSTDDKEKKKQIATEWDIQVATAIAPYVQQYGAESISSSNDVVDFLDGYLIIPTDYTKYKGKSTYNPKVNMQRGYAKQFIKDIFGAKK